MNLSIAIMYHPSRAHRIPGLVAACAPFEARPVVDPDPTGPPSPLRTAKRAWAAIADGATHHLVLQDDAVPAPGFPGLLASAVAARPRHGISLYSHWDSPQNSYLVRRAAVAGSAWAALSPQEWTPSQGFVLPADEAGRLAEFLRTVPDSVRDDDEMITVFCRENGIPTVATVPHLVDHADSPTLAEHPGRFRATVFAARHALPPGHWDTPDTPNGFSSPRRHLVELRDSRCFLRFVRPGTPEPAEHSYGWYWRDWSGLIGLDPDVVLKAHADAGAPPESLEVWAACFLLGADSPPNLTGPPSLTEDAVITWLESGLTGTPTPPLLAIALAAVHAGSSHTPKPHT